jgi:hypothetical protein
MSPLTFVIAGLATYRLTRMVTRDSIAEPLREKIWKKYPPESTKIGYLITCDWCTSIWIASGLQISRTIMPSGTKAVESILALSAVAGLLAAHEERD